MNQISFRSLLALVAVVPLCAFLWLSISGVWDSYKQYRQLDEQIIVQQLAHAGGRLAQLMPAEAFSTPQTRMDRRSQVDQGLSELERIFAEWKGSDHRDAVIESSYSLIQEKRSKLASYRAKVDAGTSTQADEMSVLQPIAAQGLELVRRSGATIADVDLARFIDGYHALMQVNDANLIEFGMVQTYLSGVPMNSTTTSFLYHAKGLRDRYAPVALEFLPSDLSQTLNDFMKTPDYAFMQAVRDKMYMGVPASNDERAKARWVEVASKQTSLMATLIEKAGRGLENRASTQLDYLYDAFLKNLSMAIAVSLLVASLCLFIRRTVSKMILAVQERMHSLAEGDQSSAIPYSDRADEIGDIARSVEVFRQAAIRNGQLEAEAEENRARAERERAEMQARAEADAEQRLTKATSTLAAGLKRLASGDLLCEIHEEFAPRFEALRHDFNTSVQQLRGVLVSVGHSAHVVSGGSGEISQASDDLAKRTEQQAASLEETAAALEQITSNVTATSRRTGEARDIVRNTRSRAEQSGIVVGNAVTAMERIEHASKQISQIIGVIDEIAFQTNLLALNAGVEAARAGEAGKGFAVVAQEVRELAQRSANAAKEIKALIGNSEVAVSEGVKLVNDTGDGLTAIASLVQAINEHMDAIASAAQEQSVGLGEVNQAVNHMDQATQKNAAMVEEMNAASAGLAQEAASLADLLRRFQTGDDKGGAPSGQTSGQKRSVASPSAQARSPASVPSPRATERRAMPAISGNTALSRENWEEF